jgi:enoyl-CoA hydratase
MTSTPVLLDVSDRIATITLNRPEARNALSSELLRLLPKVLHQADADPEVDVIVLTGADPAFCAGLDLKELGSSAGNLGGTGADGGSNASGVRGPFPQLRKSPSPAASSWPSTATSSSPRNGPSSATPTRASASCRDGG